LKKSIIISIEIYQKNISDFVVKFKMREFYLVFMKVLHVKLILVLFLCILFYLPFTGLSVKNASNNFNHGITILTSNSEEWIANYGANSGSQGNKVAIDSEGNVYVAGWYYNQSTTPSSNATLWKYSTSGVLLWVREWGGGFSDQARSIYIDALNNIYVTGYFYNSGYGYDIFIKKFSINGDILGTYNISSSIADYGNEVFVDPAGNIYITGYTSGVEGWTCYTAKLDPSGVILWDAFYGQNGSGNYDLGEGLIVDNDGNVFVCGYTESYTNGKGPLFLKYNSSGFLEFNISIPDFMGGEFFDIDMNSQGDVYLIGYCDYDLYLNPDIFICKYNRIGLSLWNYIGGTDLYDYGRAIIIDSNDNTYAICDTGQGAGMALRDIQIKKFNVDGQLIWDTIWTRGLTDNAMDAALDIESHDLYITGYSTAFSTSGIDSMILIKNPVLPDENDCSPDDGGNPMINLSISDILSIVNTGALIVVITAVALKLKK